FSIGIASSPDGTLSSEQRDQLIQQALNGNNSGGSSVNLHLTGDDQGPIGEALNRLITGQASAADFQQLVTHLQSSADSVTVEESGPGHHLLTATGLDVDATPTSAGGQTHAATMRISYKDGQGVEWAELLHVGDADGTIRFERADIG